MTVLLTGASGFVGSEIIGTANKRGIRVRPVYRSINLADNRPDAVFISGLDGSTDWSQALHDIDVVIHSAALVHVMHEDGLNRMDEYNRVNLHGTVNLAQQAASAGVRRFVFISSVKVNGDVSKPGCPFTADDVPNPGSADGYALSKAEAETQLMSVAQQSGMEVTIIRPPLIYGPGVKGNFASLIDLVRRGLPLPFGAVIHNRRSLVGLDNLVDLILLCIDHPRAANQIFLISDGEDLSTNELINRIGKALNRSICLLWIPAKAIKVIAALAGKGDISQRLLGTLQVDINKTCKMLNWKPVVMLDEGLRNTVKEM